MVLTRELRRIRLQHLGARPELALYLVTGTTAVLLLALRLHEAPPALLSTFSTRFLGIFIEAVPFLLLGSVVSGLIEVFIPREWILRLIPRHPLLAALGGVGLGFVFPVCECGVVPVTRRLYAKGLPLSVGVVFLLASPVMNPIVLVSTWTAFGLGPMLLGRYLITAVVAVSVGLVFAVATRPRELLQPVAIAPAEMHPEHDSHHHSPETARSRGSLTLQLARDEFFDMARYLVIGTLLATSLQTLVPQELLTSLGRDPVVSVLAMQGLAYVLSVCSTVDAFLALAFTGTFSTGALLAFLTFGPMVDVKSTLMFLSVFRPKTVGYLLLLPLLMTMAIAIWLNLNVPG
jgi:uncharacterized protein